MKLSKIHIGPAKCSADLNDGSERGLYVDQDYILQKLHRPHRSVNIMYCYYPLDKTWPLRAQDAYKDMEIGFAWDYPYDNYFPYLGGVGGNTDGEPFTCIRDIRRHGQDVTLTLTCDPNVSDEHIIAIAKDLRTFGRMQLRLNHEATGNWFSFTKRASYSAISDFFVRFSKIMKQYAPNVNLITCIGGIESPDATRITMEDEFLGSVLAADVWSVDKYIALNWGWPYEVAKKDNFAHKLEDPAFTYEMTKRSFYRYRELNDGVAKPMMMAEINVDGDVTGPFDQVKHMMKFFELIKNDPERWFTAFCMYQFRDDGRLGLEITDPNNKNVGIEQPLLKAYRDVINDDFFKPEITAESDATLPATLRWGGSEDSDGIAMDVILERQPVYCELNFPESLKAVNMMIEFAGRWFYKAPGTVYVDLMPAFYEKQTDGRMETAIRFFAPPASGENDCSQGEDWMMNYYMTISELPELRLEYEPVVEL